MDLAIPIAANCALGLLLLVWFALHRTREPVRLASPQEALRIFQRRFPEADGMASVSAEGEVALISLRRGSGIGLVHRHGRRWNARQILPEDLRSATAGPDGEITLALADLGWPRTVVRIEDADQRSAWLARLARLARARGVSRA